MAMESGLKARLVTTVVLVLVFGSGLTMGLALDRTPETAPTEEDARPERADGSGDRSRRDRGPRPLLVEQVGLTVEQKSQVDQIVEESRKRMKGLENETQPRYHSIIEETRTAIKEVLTDEQRAEYDALLAERAREREERRRSRSNSGRDSGR